MKFAFVGYTDHGGESGRLNSSYPVELKNFDTGAQLCSFLNNVTTSGGGDSEAVIDGLYAASELTWEKDTMKFLFHIGD